MNIFRPRWFLCPGFYGSITIYYDTHCDSILLTSSSPWVAGRRGSSLQIRIQMRRGGVDGVYGPQSAPLFWWCSIAGTKKSYSALRAIHPHNLRNIISTCSGGLPPSSEDDGAGRKATYVTQGCHSHRRWPWSAVDGGWDWSLLAVGGWWRHIIFHSHVDSIQCWHLTRPAKKTDLEERPVTFRWF